MKRIVCAVGLLAFCLSLEAKTPKGWQTDCVGRLQLGLPGGADVAALTPKGFRYVLSPSTTSLSRTDYMFPDGQRAAWTSFYLAAGLDISHPLTTSEKNEIAKLLHNTRNNAENFYNETKISMVDLPLGTLQGVAWESSKYYLFSTLFVENVSLSWETRLTNQTDFETRKRNYQTIIHGLRQRSIFETPHEPGVCLPYLFVRDDNQLEHGIAMTYRLTEQPDITINLRSGSARPMPDKGDGRETVSNEYRTQDFWDQRLTPVDSFQSVWRRPLMAANGIKTRPVKLAGRDGLASFVSLVRKPGEATNYMYHAVARGNPETPEAVPDIRLFVEQHRTNAEKRNIQPLSQEEFLKLAEAIAASVGVRPTE